MHSQDTFDPRGTLPFERRSLSADKRQQKLLSLTSHLSTEGCTLPVMRWPAGDNVPELEVTSSNGNGSGSQRPKGGLHIDATAGRLAMGASGSQWELELLPLTEVSEDTELAVPDLHVSPVLTSLYMEPLVPLLPQQQRVQKVLHESKVLPDQIHTPDVMPTRRHMKYLSINTA
ncbi:hypothetical protein EYF80_014599 [Liparis tanakae]|uniref:Uncharacterized protein n=1 Tax=Liparis tanakae TaxID=230148 RepID=A0A4Z2IAU4_9TELE|nr:hypothetical protein EYF80_014599 [Liparis tanakae]